VGIRLTVHVVVVGFLPFHPKRASWCLNDELTISLIQNLSAAIKPSTNRNSYSHCDHECLETKRKFNRKCIKTTFTFVMRQLLAFLQHKNRTCLNDMNCHIL